MKVALTFLLTVFTATATMAAGPVCKTIFASPEAERQAVEKMIKELSALRLEIDQKRSAGESSVILTALDRDFYNKENSFLESVSRSKVISSEQYIERMKTEMARMQKTLLKDLKEEARIRAEDSRRKKEQVKNTLDSLKGAQALFHPIEPGRMIVKGMDGQDKEVVVSAGFEMMETVTTQYIWEKIAVLAEAKFGKELYNLPHGSSKVKGDLYPVENTSFDTVQRWLKALNDLSAAAEPGLAEVIPSHQQGDVYRLPTQAEWDFVLCGRGLLNDTYFFGNDPAQMTDYLWYADNSGGKPHEVAQKKPLVFEGKEFFDMLGNVSQYIDSEYNNEKTLSFARGGAYHEVGRKVGRFSMSWNPADKGREDIGFRFVREARK